MNEHRRISRRCFIDLSGRTALSALVLSSLAHGKAPSTSASRKRPNILLITLDDLGVELGCYGDSFARTPHMDALARESVLFKHGFVTQPSCSPSRSSILTGLYPHQNGQIGLTGVAGIHDHIPLLPERLKEAGYRNGGLGKWHVVAAARRGTAFDVYNNLVEPDQDDRRNPSAFAREAARFMTSDSKQPFFLYVNYVDPHRPLYNQRHGYPKNPVGADEIEPFPFLAGVDTPAVRQEVAGYYNCVERVDIAIGMLMDELKNSGQEENTLVILVGDHGAPFTRAKCSLYEAGLHIPYFIRWPGHAAVGHASSALVSTVDIMPTILEAAGIDPPELQAGRSLLPLLSGRSAPWRETVCGEYTMHGRSHYFPRRSIRDHRYKLITNLLQDRPNPIRGVDGCSAWEASRKQTYDGTLTRKVYDRYHEPPPIELFDLENDPTELNDLSGDPLYAGTRERLLRTLGDWQEETGDPVRDPEKFAAQKREYGRQN